ncbi:MAG: flagellar FlbD family protein, partial [Bacillota bacterium]|nr:flagellar FlbD family protein [Bacillota bacterium]
MPPSKRTEIPRAAYSIYAGGLIVIELTYLNGIPFVMNCNLIETIESIPETKVMLTNGKYFL